MRTKLFLSIVVIAFVYACGNGNSGAETKDVQKDTVKTDYLLSRTADSVIQNGEYIKYYKNGVIQMRGVMKDGQREGVWKSWYENGSPWSETTFVNGKKTGKTITWYDIDKKRYEGYYTEDKETGHWTFWDLSGKVQQEKDYK